MAAAREQKSRLLAQTLEAGLFQRARGRCECEGLCGHNHVWNPEAPFQRCSARHGVNIVRKTGHPSCVWNAPLQGFTTHMEKELGLVGPRTHAPKKFVTEGNVVEFAHPGHFDMNQISQVWLRAVRVARGRGDNSHRMFCQFCAHYAEKKGSLVS